MEPKLFTFKKLSAVKAGNLGSPAYLGEERPDTKTPAVAFPTRYALFEFLGPQIFEDLEPGVLSLSVGDLIDLGSPEVARSPKSAISFAWNSKWGRILTPFDPLSNDYTLKASKDGTGKIKTEQGIRTLSKDLWVRTVQDYKNEISLAILPTEQLSSADAAIGASRARRAVDTMLNFLPDANTSSLPPLLVNLPGGNFPKSREAALARFEEECINNPLVLGSHIDGLYTLTGAEGIGAKDLRSKKSQVEKPATESGSLQKNVGEGRSSEHRSPNQGQSSTEGQSADKMYHQAADNAAPGGSCASSNGSTPAEAGETVPAQTAGEQIQPTKAKVDGKGLSAVRLSSQSRLNVATIDGTLPEIFELLFKGIDIFVVTLPTRLARVGLSIDLRLVPGPDVAEACGLAEGSSCQNHIQQLLQQANKLISDMRSGKPAVAVSTEGFIAVGCEQGALEEPEAEYLKIVRGIIEVTRGKNILPVRMLGERTFEGSDCLFSRVREIETSLGIAQAKFGYGRDHFEGYVHHLLNCREILGHQLIEWNNIRSFQLLFKLVRNVLSSTSRLYLYIIWLFVHNCANAELPTRYSLPPTYTSE